MSMDVRSIVAAASAQERRLEVLANNMANINTVGYKARRPVFSTLPFDAPQEADPLPGPLASLGESVRPEGADRLQFSVGLQMIGVKTDFQTGDFLMTGNPLDLALNGPGLFAVETPKGLRYTRNGSFVLNKDKVLVTADGYPVMTRQGSVTLNGNDISIDTTGKITVDGQEAGTLRIVDFKDKDKVLRKDVAGLFASAQGVEPQEAEDFEIRAGALERSNVSVVPSMTEMIEVMRAYEAYNKVIQSLNEATQRASTEIGRLR